MAAPRDARGGTLILGGGSPALTWRGYLGRDGATIVNPDNFMLFTVALFFRRDIVELGMLGHPRGLCDV